MPTVLSMCAILVFPDLLVFFYRRWLKQEDSFTEELKGSLEAEVRESLIDNGKSS